MNIIEIANGKISVVNISSDLKINDENICINVLNNTRLYLNIHGKEDVKIRFNISKNVDFKLFNYSENKNCKIKFIVDMEEYSNLTMNNFYKNNDTKEDTIINLNGIKCNLEYNYSCLGKTNKMLTINHNFSNTNSNVKTHGVSMDDKIKFEIIEIVPKQSINCNLNQSSKIINLGNERCSIKPILLIDEKDVNASHSSIVSPISNDDLLYLMSRGIDKPSSIRLLVNGFLINNLSLIEEEKHILFEKHIFRR